MAFTDLSFSEFQPLSFYSMNPFREDLVARSMAEPCTVVIFGATGDLTHRKLIPALYNLAVDGELPTGVKIIGFARREKSDAEFRTGLAEVNRKVSRSGHDETVWNPFIENVHYHQSEFTDAAERQAIEAALREQDGSRERAADALGISATTLWRKMTRLGIIYETRG